MTIPRTQSQEFRFTGWHMLACMVAFFGTIIAVNVTMAVLASGSWTGLIVKNSYVASQHFNEDLQRAREQARHGLASTIALDDKTLSVAIRDRNGAPVFPDSVSVWLGRPAFEQQDRTLAARCERNGVCTIPADLAAGEWAMRINAVLPEGQYRRDARLYIRPDGTAKVD